VFRPDYEAVLTPVVDWLIGHKQVDTDRLVLMGRSFGGYLAPQAATGEHRFRALVADPGLYDLNEMMQNALPQALYDQIQAGDPAADAAFEKMFAVDPHKKNFFMSRATAHGAKTAREYIRMLKAYTLRGRTDQIRCPTLVAAQPGDPQAVELYNALTCQKVLAIFSEEEGAGGHCEGLAQSLFHQRIFDWLDDVLAR
jgi:dienelactone hydrolase